MLYWGLGPERPQPQRRSAPTTGAAVATAPGAAGAAAECCWHRCCRCCCCCCCRCRCGCGC
eukprot:4103744-Alexandrium_andersonii.AAC.1